MTRRFLFLITMQHEDKAKLIRLLENGQSSGSFFCEKYRSKRQTRTDKQHRALKWFAMIEHEAENQELPV